MFENQYTKENLCYANLKGLDHHVVSHPREACEELGIQVYLANLDYSISGGCEPNYDDYDDGCDYDNDGKLHDLTGISNRVTKLKRVVEFDGTEIAKDIPYNESYLIREDFLANAQPESEDYDGNASTTHFYHETVIFCFQCKFLQTNPCTR